MKASKILIGVAVLALIAAFFILDLGQYFSLEFLKDQRDAIEAFYVRRTPPSPWGCISGSTSW
jgi:hypothetical protein